MSDRFKYRVWYKPYNGYVEIRDNLVLLPNGILCEYDGIEIDSDNYIIEMCTGLKDKNGNLIYEGDIVKDWRGGVFKVVWLNEQAQFFAESPKCDTDGYFLDDNICFFEIIGNIHEQLEQGE